MGKATQDLRKEHEQGREHIAQMSRSIEEKNIDGFNRNAEQYRDLLRNHIEKENNVLFQMADKVIDEKEQNIMFEKFEAHEENVIGHGVHEQLHAMINVWAKDFGVE
jgi:hemerythrin-like domain-containing protein